MKTFKLCHHLVMTGLLAAGLVNCNGKNSPTSGQTETEKTAQQTLRAEDLPDCTQIASILGDLVIDMVPAPALNGGRFNNVTAFGIECMWVTRESLSNDPSTNIKTGSFGVGITVDENALKEAPLRKMNMIYDDARVKALGGFVVYMGAKLNPDDPLGTVGPQVVVGKVTVTSAATGVLLKSASSMREITNNQAIEAAVVLHKFLQ